MSFRNANKGVFNNNGVFESLSTFELGDLKSLYAMEVRAIRSLEI